MVLKYCIIGLIVIALFSEINGFARKFRCNNGKFISSEYFCDGDDDCGDASDESYGCSSKTECRRGKFTCENQQCVNISARCNTQLDCSDGSDERNCSHELSINNCTIQEGRFLCNDKLRCLHLNETCDGEKNCFDNSDETDLCFEYDVDVCSHCGHPCLRTPLGPVCYYDKRKGTSHALYAVIKDCSIYENNCEQKCVKFRGILQCSCGEHYKTDENSTNSCLSLVPYGEIVIYSTHSQREIRTLNTTSGEITAFRLPIFSNTFAFTGAHDYTYWGTGDTIVKRSMYGKNANKSISSIPKKDEKIIIPFSNYVINGIAIDWITGNIYISSRELLSVCDNNGRLCAKLNDSPSSFFIECLALAPKHGLMFWILNTKNSYYFRSWVYKSAMDGSEADAINGGIFTIYKSLVVDENSEKLYWLNILQGRIESTSFYDDFNGRTKIEKLDARNFFSFGILENVFYWTIDFSNIIYSDKPFKRKLLVENITVKYLYVYNPFLQQTTIPNPCSSNPCKGLCVIRNSLSKIIDYSCICEDIRVIKNSTGGHGQWCNYFRNGVNDTVINDIPTEMFLSSTSSPNQSSTTKIQYSRNTDSGNAAGGRIKIFFVIIIIASISAASYFLLKRWKKNGNRDGMRMRFFRKNDNADL